MTNLLHRHVVNAVTEAELQRTITEALDVFGWLHFHDPNLRRCAGCGHLNRDARRPGFPDIVAVRNGDLLFYELKTEKGRESVEQRAWLEALAEVPGIDVGVWRPRDLDAALVRLR